MSGKEIEIVKKVYSRDRFNADQIEELKKCISDPVHFCESYVKVQHPTKGRLPFTLYPYQVHMIRSFHRNQFCICLTARQMGKSVHESTVITNNEKKIEIRSLFSFSTKEKLVGYLEKIVLKMVIKHTK
jgi:hypothetical protein